MLSAAVFSVSIELNPYKASEVTRRHLNLGATYAVAFGMSRPSNALERDVSNSNAIFREDYYFKFGKKPLPLRTESQLSNDPPFVRIQTRYEAYGKYAPKVKAGLAAFKDLERAVGAGDAGAVRDDANIVVLSLRPAGLLANSLLAADSISSDCLLARYYVNEVYFQISDISDFDARTGASAVQAARPFLNSYLMVINRAIPPKVGDKFDLLL